MPSIMFAGYPAPQLYELGTTAEPPANPKPKKQLLWGDYMVVDRKSANGKYYKVRSRGTNGWIKVGDVQAERLLEIVFVDIGQGDGALVVTPQDKTYVIDAGEGDNMFRFLRWRFGQFKNPFSFDAAILSHSDSDHYGGFEYLFKNANVHFKTVYSNGFMERASASDTGTIGVPKAANGQKYITELVTDLPGLKAFLAKTSNWQKTTGNKITRKKYPAMLNAGLQGGRFDDFRMLDLRNGHMPGHGPGDDLAIEVLGPYVEKADNKPALRWFGDVGKTKNGHSVVLRFKYRNVNIFMGGDLNIESSRLLLGAHTGLPGDPHSAADELALVEAARRKFACDVAKACHHGSADTLLPFMKAINPVATVISSGDDEPHAHPRADALGAIAKCSRGERPLLLSTELARSAKETIKQPEVLRKQYLEALLEYKKAPAGSKKEEAAEKKYRKLLEKLERSIAVYGAINLRTDGTKVVMAYKLEQSKPAKGWDLYKLEPTGTNGQLEYQSKFD